MLLIMGTRSLPDALRLYQGSFEFRQDDGCVGVFTSFYLWSRSIAACACTEARVCARIVHLPVVRTLLSDCLDLQ